MAVLRTVSNVPFFFCETWNNNRRYYPREVATERILSEKTKKLMEEKRLYGEINHPKDRLGTDFDFVSHVITEMYYDEEKKCIIGSYDVLDTPRGKVLNTLLEYGSNVGISARATGTSKSTKDGELIEVDTYAFKTFDVVANPGFENATVRGLVESESELSQALNTLYESFDDEDKEFVKSLYEEFYPSLINTSSQSDSEEESSHNYEEQIIDLEFELNYYKDLYEESLSSPNEELEKLLQSKREQILVLEAYKDEIVNLQEEKTKLEECMNLRAESYNKIINKLQEELKLSAHYKELYEQTLNQLEESRDRVDECLSDIDEQNNNYSLRLESLEELNNSLLEYISSKDKLIEDLQQRIEESLQPLQSEFNLVTVQNVHKSNDLTRQLYKSMK